MNLSADGLQKCKRCPRLAARHREVRMAYPDYHAAPVGAWGDLRGRLIIIGLAPGLHGATRTGKAFVGDASGDFLFAGLYRQGYASNPRPANARLSGVLITNVVKCLPPGNAPAASEVNNCSGHLREELRRYCPERARKPRVLLALGGVAYRGLCRALEVPVRGFGHARHRTLQPSLHLLSSFHPSRLNVNTGRLTATMLDEVLIKAARLLDQ